MRAEGETGLPGVHQVNGMKQVFGIAVFEQVTPGPGFHGLGYQVGIVVPAYNNDLYPGIVIPYLAGGFQPIHDRHINVYQHNVGEADQEEVQEFLAIGGNMGDAEGRVSSDEVADSGDEEPVIIRQHNVNRHVRSLQVHE